MAAEYIPYLFGPVDNYQSLFRSLRLLGCPTVEDYVLDIHPSIPIEENRPTTTDIWQQSRLRFREFEDAGKIVGYKKRDKQRYTADVVRAIKQAAHLRCCLRFNRGKRVSDYSLKQQVLDAFVGCGYLKVVIAPAGRCNRVSRYVPTCKILEQLESDPWQFDAERPHGYVIMHNRETKQPIPHDPNNAVAVEYQWILEAINACYDRHRIECRCKSKISKCFTHHRILRPFPYAVFSGDFDRGGRIYTGKYGHGDLSKEDRQHISIDGQPCVEIDYKGLHLRMLYHTLGIRFAGDPYDLWDGETPEEEWQDRRMLVKLLVNALINAKDDQAAVSACNFAMRQKNDDGEWKKGNALLDARELHDAWKRAGLKFADLVPLIRYKHRRVAKFFGSDYGVILQRVDSQIVLEIMYYFAAKDVVCLGVHDSFIVPVAYEQELIEQMVSVYAKHVSGGVPELSIIPGFGCGV